MNDMGDFIEVPEDEINEDNIPGKKKNVGAVNLDGMSKTKKTTAMAVNLEDFGITMANDNLPMTKGEMEAKKKASIQEGLEDPQLKFEETDEEVIQKFYNNAFQVGIFAFCLFVIYYISKGNKVPEVTKDL